MLDRHRGCLQTLNSPVNYLYGLYLEARLAMSHFGNGNILSKPSHFIRQCKMNVQIFCFCILCHVRCQTIWVQDFHFIFYINSRFLLVKCWRKCWSLCYYTHNLSSTWECHDELDGTLFSWSFFYRMDHGWQLTTCNEHICKNKKPCLYVKKKLAQNFPDLSNASLGKSRSISFIFVFYLLSFIS